MIVKIITIFMIYMCFIGTFQCEASEILNLTASWYSIQSLKDEGTYSYSKGVMADGHVFEDYKFTCATRDYPLHSKIAVVNKANGRSVVVLVTDRTNKRFKGKRIDLSKGAFSRIADLKQGVIQVQVRPITEEGAYELCRL